MENEEISPNVPPAMPKTEGRKKIRIARIEDTRSRQVTFLKRKNGLLKKAMELGILCDCEVSVIIFNTSNGKLFEYSSVETEKVLQKYATYSGPSERRKKEHFFDLSKSKGTSNIPLNEPTLAQAAMNAAAAAARRPRPTYKFTTADETESKQEYPVHGRKLSSGETPAGPFSMAQQELPAASSSIPQRETPQSVNRNSDNYEYPSKRQKLTQPISTPTVASSSLGMVPPIQLPDPGMGRPSFMSFTPRFPASVPVPSALTPHTASRHLSAFLGLPEQPSRSQGLTPTQNTRNALSIPSSAAQTLDTTLGETYEGKVPSYAHSFAKPHSRSVNLPPKDLNQRARETSPAKPASPLEVEAEEKEISEQVAPLCDSNPNSSGGSKSQDSKPSSRTKPNLKVHIPSPNRDDLVAGTPSGLNSQATPSTGDEQVLGAPQVPRLSMALTPTGQAGWSTWGALGSTDRDTGPVPLTPFLNMESLSGPPDLGGTNLALPSPTDAGLIPLTPRGFGLDILLSARPSHSTTDIHKRPFDAGPVESNRHPDPRRPFS